MRRQLAFEDLVAGIIFSPLLQELTEEQLDKKLKDIVANRGKKVRSTKLTAFLCSHSHFCSCKPAKKRQKKSLLFLE